MLLDISDSFYSENAVPYQSTRNGPDGFACIHRRCHLCQHLDVAVDDTGKIHHFAKADDPRPTQQQQRSGVGRRLPKIQRIGL
jgi:hypothetical protein